MLLTLVTVVFFHQLLFRPDKALCTNDIYTAHSEYKFVQWHSLSDWGRFPLWDPTVFCGKSIVGDSLPAVLNPPQWLFWATPSPVLFGYMLWFYVTLGAWGMFLFARRKGCDPWGAVLAAVVFTLGGKVAGHLYAGHLEVLATMLCLPWIMLAVENVLETPTLARAGLLGGAFALTSTCGSIQFIYWHFLFVGAYGLLWLAVAIRGKGWRSAIRPAFALAAGMASFLVFAAPWWIPIIGQTLLLVARAQGTDYQFASSYSPMYVDLLHLIWPFHGILPPVSAEFGRGLNVDDACFWERTIYLGIIPLALLPSACLWTRKNRSGGAIILALLVVSFLLGLGNHGPLFWLATRVIPGLQMFRCPGRFFLYTGFLAALLCGMFLSGEGPQAAKRTLLAMSGALLAVVAAGALLLPRMEGASITRVSLPLIVLALFVPGTLFWVRGVLPLNFWKAAVLVLVCCDLFVIWQDHVVVAVAETLHPAGPVLDHLTEKHHQEEFRILASGGAVNQATAAKYGLEMVGGYHPGIYSRYIELYKAIWKADNSITTKLEDHFVSDVARPVILDLMNVNYLIAAPSEPAPVGTTAVPIPGEPRAKVYRRNSALPRVCIVPGAAMPPPGVSLLDAVCAMDPRAGCLVEDRSFSGGDAFRPLPFERKSTSDLTVRFTSEKGGVVLLSQAWHPDFRATDHGQPVEVRRVNYDFVGVCVGPGEHELRVWYWPWDFYLGCYIALAGWATLGALGAWAAWKRSRPAQAL